MAPPGREHSCMNGSGDERADNTCMGNDKTMLIMAASDYFIISRIYPLDKIVQIFCALWPMI